jgi:hypothetical protein
MAAGLAKEDALHNLAKTIAKLSPLHAPNPQSPASRACATACDALQKTWIIPKNTACPCGLANRPAASSASSTGVLGQAVAHLNMPEILATPVPCQPATHLRKTWIIPKNTACPCGLANRPTANSASSTGVPGQAVAHLNMPEILATPVPRYSHCPNCERRRSRWW